MWHANRVWSVKDSESIDDLTQAIANGGNWTLCTGFRLNGYLFLNDSISENSVVEFGIVRESDMKQVETITFGWCNAEKTRGYIEQVIAGEFTAAWGGILPTQIEPTQGHRCRLCA